MFGNMNFVAFLAIYAVTGAYACDSYDFSKGVFSDDSYKDDDVENNSTVHDEVVWPARLLRKEYNFTELLVAWDNPNSAGNELCAYRLHYYPERSAKSNNDNGKHRSVYIMPNVTEYRISGLDKGTTYHAYLEAIFEKNIPSVNMKKLKSWILVTPTRGIGPDNPCSCNKLTTVNNDTNNCDVYTTQCKCKYAYITGRRCDSCLIGYVMDPEFGCVACDNCPSDTKIGDGSCELTTEAQRHQCRCFEGYKGFHCEQCAAGFFRFPSDTKYCVPCNCSNNQKSKVQDFCDSATGKCKACDFHTSGEHCDECYPGYSGDALTRTCTLTANVGHKVGVAILIIIIIIVVIIVGIVMFRRWAKRHRKLQFFSVMRGSMGSSSAVNFATLEEEPDFDFTQRDRKLHIVGSSAST